MSRARAAVRVATLVHMPVSLLLALVAWCAGHATPPIVPVTRSPDRPNVVLVVVDDLGSSDFSCTGGTRTRTPAIDRLASQGTSFTQAYAASPVCSPSRAALLTGRSPAALGITDWIPGDHPAGMPLATPQTARALPAGVPTVAGALRAAGYRTASIGKWHLGGAGSLPTDHGFDVNLFGSEAGQPSSYRFPFGKGDGDFWQVRPLPPGAKEGDELTDLQAREAARFIEQSSRDGKPFFLYLPLFAVHAPLDAPYATMVARVDAAVGRVLAALDDMGDAGRTLVIVTSDNGGVERVGDNGALRGFKGTLWEGGIRVPLIVRWPGVGAPGTRSDVATIGQDLAATILDAAGLPPPAGVAGAVHAQSLRVPASAAALDARHPAGWDDRPLLWHYPHYHTAQRPPMTALREGAWKLVRFDGTDRVELHDLSKDPEERSDLAAREPARAAAMTATMDRMLDAVHAPRATVPAAPAAVPAAPADAPPAAHPNLVVILCDDMGWGDVPGFALPGFTPPAYVREMPNLARLAREGASFTDFYVAQPVCSASRAAILTGCYPNRIGISGALFPGAKVGIADEERTLAELLRAQGYGTGIFGKWHLGDAPRFNPLRHGFDEWLGMPYSNDMWPLRQKASPRLPLMDGERVLRYVDSVEDQAPVTRLLTERATAFIRGRAAERRPFFCYLAHHQPHAPIAAGEGFRPADRAQLYAGVMRELDWSVGEVLRALDETGTAKDTIVLFTSDNGPWLAFGADAGSAGGLREGKGTTFEGGVREPCILRWPGHVPAGARSAVPWMAIDLLPTMAAIVGAPAPAADRPIDGTDARAVWTCAADANPTHESFLFYYDGNALEAVRMGRWKLVLPHESRTLAGRAPGAPGTEIPYVNRAVPLALYDLVADPAETTDVSAAHPDVVAAAMRHVEAARADLGDGLTKRQGAGRRAPGRIDAAAVPAPVTSPSSPAPSRPPAGT